MMRALDDRLRLVAADDDSVWMLPMPGRLLSDTDEAPLGACDARIAVCHNPLIVRLQQECHLDGADILAIESLCGDTRALSRGFNLVRYGERSERVHLILSGWAARYKLLADGSRQITALLLPGDLCNLRGTMLARTDDGIVALTTIWVASIDPARISELETSRPRIAQAMAWYGLYELAMLRAWIVNLGRRPALERVAHLFSELSVRLTVLSDASETPQHIALTQEEIADVVGLTAVHVNRVLTKMRQCQLITARRGGISLIDLPMLKRLAGFTDTYLSPTMGQVGASFLS